MKEQGRCRVDVEWWSRHALVNKKCILLVSCVCVLANLSLCLLKKP